MNGYELSRSWWNFAFENPEKVRPIHAALYFFAVEHCNRLGWKKKFGLPTEMAKDAIGVKSWHTYISAFNDLVDWGFFELIERSKNQYSSNIIALIKFDEALDKALDKAITKHASKHQRSTHQSNDSINKLITIEPITIKPKEQEIIDLWNTMCSPPLSRVEKLTKSRKTKIATRSKEIGNMDNIKNLFVKIKDSNFLNGYNSKNWKATFDWVLENDKNWVKILEGNFDNKKEEGAKENQVSSPPAWVTNKK